MKKRNFISLENLEYEVFKYEVEITVSRQSGTVGWLGNFWPEGAFLNVLKPPPATRIRDPRPSRARPVPRGFTMPPDPGPCFPPAGPAHSDSDGYALNVPPMLSSDQLLLVPLGHTP